MADYFAPVPGALYRDEYGRPSVAVEFGKDPEYKGLDAVLAGRVTATSIADETADRLARLSMTFRARGIKESPEMLAAVEVYKTVSNLVHYPQYPDIIISDPADVEAAIASAIDHETRAEATRKVRELMMPQVAERLTFAVRGMMPVVLTAVEPRFNAAAKAFTEVYPKVAGIESVTQAALADQTGETVAAWHKVKSTVAELNGIADFVWSVDVDGYGRQHNKRDYPVRFYTLGADIAAGDVKPFMSATGRWANNEVFNTDDRVSPPQFPLGIWPHLLETGVELSLPKNLDDWTDRIDSYNDAKDEIMMSLFR